MSESVVSEPRVYALDSPHSYYLDVLQATWDPQGLQYPSAHGRLLRYAGELAHEIREGTPEGLRADRAIRERTRTADADAHEQRHRATMRELRAVGVTTGGGTTVSAPSGAAAFVVPAFLMPQWAPYRDTYRTFADQCHVLPMPAYGMDICLPLFLSAASAGQQAEGSGVSELDPSTSLQSSPVTTQAGQVVITKQVYDRFWQGGAADAVFAAQLRQHLNQKVDAFALAQVIAGGATVPGAASLTANSWKEVYGDIAKGREQLADTAGTRLRSTHLFTTYDLFSALTSIMGSDQRPMVMPISMPGLPLETGADDGLNGGGPNPKWSRFTGVVLPGNVLWFTDDNIPPSGPNTQLLVSAPDQAVVILESADPMLLVAQETYAGSLATVISSYEYVAVITRHASGTAVISGNAYPATLK